MKRIDLGEDTAYVYGVDEDLSKIPDDGIQKVFTFLNSTTKKPLISICEIMGSLLKRKVYAAMVLYDENGRVLGTSLTGDNIREPLAAMKIAVERLEEAKKKEGN